MLIILCAHKIEAQPFIQHYGLGGVASMGGPTLFTNPRIQLFLTGQGVQNARTSLSKFLLRFPPQGTEIYLNFGVAGSSEFKRGTIVAIDQINDPATNMPLIIEGEGDHTIPRCPCHTVHEVECKFRLNGVYDMEAAALGVELKRIRLLNKLRVLKLVSDGPDHRADRLSQAAIRQLVAENTDQILSISDKLLVQLCNK